MADTVIASTSDSQMVDSPLWMQAAGGDSAINYAGADDRALLEALHSAEGVLGGIGGDFTTALKLSQRGAGANFSVDCAAGYAIISGNDGANQRPYIVRSNGVVNIATPTAPGSGTRIHRVIARIRDKQVIGSGTYDWTLELREDTGSGTPAEPASAITLGLVSIAAGQASVLDANITDLRVAAVAPGTLLAENIRTAGDQTISAGNKLIVQSLTLPVSSGRKYLVTFESRMGSTATTNLHLFTLKAATGTTVLTSSADIGPTRSWAAPTVNFDVNIYHSSIWTPGSTGQFTVGFCADFFSGSSTSSVKGNGNDAGILRVWAAR